MNIIAKSASVQSSFDLYNLTKAPNRHKLVDIKGQTVTLKSWALYEEENNKGEMVKILSITTDGGEGYATNSATFIRDFESAVDMFKEFGDEFHQIQVVPGTSKNGREYISCLVIA